MPRILSWHFLFLVSFVYKTFFIYIAPNSTVIENPNKIVIYTDGSSRGNPGPGGFGAILIFGQLRKELSQGFRKTTNNRMELLAVIIALESLKINTLPVAIFTDSKYVVDSVSKKWLDKWIKTNFAGGKKNKDLWLRYAKIAANFQIQFNWVKGHADNPLNNRCDLLATTAADGKDLLIDIEFEKNM